MPGITLVVFDLAGTTVQDDGQVPRAFTSALSAHGIPVSPEQVNRVRGSSKRQAMLRFIPEGPDRAQLAESVYAAFHQSLATAYRTEGVAPVAGARELLAGFDGMVSESRSTPGLSATSPTSSWPPWAGSMMSPMR